jgi:hypothetical protein
VPKLCSEGSAKSDVIFLMDCKVEQRLDVGFEGSSVSTPGKIGSLSKSAFPALPIG